MALDMPVVRKPMDSGRMTPPDNPRPELPREMPFKEWTSSHQEELLNDFKHGRGDVRLNDEQNEGVRKVFTEASGADRTMSPSQVRDALHRLEQGRVGLDIDKGTFEAIHKRVSEGPDTK